MKLLLSIPCACLLVSCGSPSIPSAPVSPPTVAPLPAVERPSVERVAPLARVTSQELTRAKTENDRLRDTVDEAHAANASLSGLLSRSIKEGQATKERLLEIESLVNEEKRLNVALKESAEVQTATIDRLQANAAKMEEEVAMLSQKISVSNQRLADNQTQLEAANSRIAELAEAHNTAVQNALEWRDEVAQAEGRISAEKSWKWRFFWWAVGATILIVGYVGLRLHPATRALIP